MSRAAPASFYLLIGSRNKYNYFLDKVFKLYYIWYQIMPSIKTLCRKALTDWKILTFDEMYRLARYFGKVKPAKGSKFNIFYPSDSPKPIMQLHKPHGGRGKDVPLDYKQEFRNIFADEMEEEVKNENE